jgi:hypothetical protein
MLNEEISTMTLSGSYRDVMSDAAGRVTWDSGWRKNTIVLDCRRLLAAFMCQQQGTLGIGWLRVGAGNPDWDNLGTGHLPPPGPMTKNLEDSAAVDVPLLPVAFSYVDENGSKSEKTTNRLQIVATLAPGVPTWLDAKTNPKHGSVTLREFGLVGTLGVPVPAGSPPGTLPTTEKVLINAVRHVAIAKSSIDTLVRTIQLVF